MPRLFLSSLAFLWACSCGGGESKPPPVPRPANLAGFDARVITRIEEVVAKVEAAPASGAAWAELGLVYASERLKPLALECFAVAARLEPRQPKWPYREAVTHAQSGEFEAAIAAMERSLVLEPGYPPSHSRLGDYRLALGDLERAATAYRRATELDSSYPGGWVGLARVALQRDQPAEAIAILERLTQKDPEDRTFAQLLARARGESPQGAELTDPALLGGGQVPVWNDPWELEARAFRQSPVMLQVPKLLEAGKASEALALLESERARGADPFETSLFVARALADLGRPAEALAELETNQLTREPENTQALLLKANLLDDNGDIPGAVAVLETVTKLQPSFGGAFAAKALKLHRLGYHEPAVAAFERALELGEGDFELRFALGESHIVLKQWPAAFEVFTALVAERPGHGDAWVELAIARLRTGSLEGGEEALARARECGNASPRLLSDVTRSLEAARARRSQKESGGG